MWKQYIFIYGKNIRALRAVPEMSESNMSWSLQPGWQIYQNSLIVFKFPSLLVDCLFYAIFQNPLSRNKTKLVFGPIAQNITWTEFSWQTICEQVQNYHSCQGQFSSTFSVVGSVNFRTRLERPLVWSIGDSEIFHVQLLKMVTKNDPGNYDNFVLVHI